MRISCDLFTHAVLWLPSQHYFAIAFEAYRPKLGKSLKKTKGAKSTVESFLAGGMYGKCLISPPFLRLEAILTFVYFLLNFKLDAIFSDCEKV